MPSTDGEGMQWKGEGVEPFANPVNSVDQAC
jgi:hypothetical protein